MSKRFIYGFVVGLALLTVAGVGASRRHQRDVKGERDRAELAQYKAEIVDATEVQLGELTQRERIHGALYAYRSLTGNRTIRDLVRNAGGKVLGINVLTGQGPAFIEPQTPESYFGELVRASDAVIRGRVTKKLSQVTEDGAFIFTDYDMELREVLKNSSAIPLAIGATITVTRPGGKVVTDGIVVKASDQAFGPLPLDGRTVLLFLRYIPETGAYRATRDVGAFEADGASILPLTAVRFPPGVLRDGDSLLRMVREISSR